MLRLNDSTVKSFGLVQVFVSIVLTTNGGNIKMYSKNVKKIKFSKFLRKNSRKTQVLLYFLEFFGVICRTYVKLV